MELAEEIKSQVDAQSVTAKGGLAKVSVVGAGLTSSLEYASTMFGTLADLAVNIDMISTSGIRITCVIDGSRAADAVRALSSDDGSVLLFNVHLSSHQATPIEFPESDEGLPDQYAKLLFSLSSLLPAYMRSAAQSEGYAVSDGTRGFVFNADMVAVIRFLDIGTRPSNLR